MQFARQAFPNAVIPQNIINGLANNVDELPILLISKGDNYERTKSLQDNAIGEIIRSFHSNDHNIAILVPFQSDVRVFESVLNNKGFSIGTDYSS